MSYFSDNFTLINKIGSGSFGEVYIAQNIKGKKFLTYLSNLDLPVDLKNADNELLVDYLNGISLVNINFLENILNTGIQFCNLNSATKKVQNYNTCQIQNGEVCNNPSLASVKLFMLTTFQLV